MLSIVQEIRSSGPAGAHARLTGTCQRAQAIEQERHTGRHECAEQRRENQDEPPKIADALLERPLSRQAVDPSADNENGAYRERTPDSGFENLGWAHTLPSPADPRPMNRDPKRNATVYGKYRAHEREEINITTSAKSRDWDCDCVDQKRWVAD